MSKTLDLSPDELLTTTRAVRRRLDFDRPVPRELVEQCVRIVLQAPTGSNARGWHFVVVSDPDKRRAVGLGTSWTTLHLIHEEAVAEILGIPFAEVMQTALSPLAYTVGTDFQPAKNRDIDSALHVDSW